MKNLVVALYKTKLTKKRIFSKIKILPILKIFKKLEKETKVKFREDLD